MHHNRNTSLTGSLSRAEMWWLVRHTCCPTLESLSQLIAAKRTQYAKQAEHKVVSLLNLTALRSGKTTQEKKLKARGLENSLEFWRSHPSLAGKICFALTLCSPVLLSKPTFSFFPLSCAVVPIPQISFRFLTTLSFCQSIATAYFWVHSQNYLSFPSYRGPHLTDMLLDISFHLHPLQSSLTPHLKRERKQEKLSTAEVISEPVTTQCYTENRATFGFSYPHPQFLSCHRPNLIGQPNKYQKTQTKITPHKRQFITLTRQQYKKFFSLSDTELRTK